MLEDLNQGYQMIYANNVISGEHLFFALGVLSLDSQIEYLSVSSDLSLSDKWIWTMF